MSKGYTIKECEAYMVDVPVNKEVFPFEVSYGRLNGLKRVFFKVTAENEAGDQKTGWGEASPLHPYSNETALSVFGMLKYDYGNALKGRSMGSSVEDVREGIESILSKVEPHLSRERLNFTQAVIDYALHDLGGKITGKPVYEILSDDADFTPVRACWSTSSEDGEKAVRTAEEFAGKGYAIKIKLNGDAEQDAETCITAINRAYEAAEDVVVRADANAAYTPEGFREFCSRIREGIPEEMLEKAGFYVEEPIDTRKYGIDKFMDVAEESPFRTMADETLYTLEDAVTIAEKARERGITDRIMFNIKVQKVGGLRNAMKAGRIAKENGIPVMIGGMFPTSYGKLANCHFAIAHGGVIESDGLHPSSDYIDIERPMITNIQEVEVMEDGARIVEAFKGKPGIGGEVDEEMIRQTQMNGWDDYYPDFEAA